MTLERPAGHAATLHLAVGEALADLVAARASQAAVDRQALVVEQRLAERTLCVGEWIVGGKWHGCGTAERGLERGEVVLRLRKLRFRKLRFRKLRFPLGGLQRGRME